MTFSRRIATFVARTALVTFAVAAAAVSASPILIVSDQGLLLGADGVVVDGESYDVRFQDGTFEDLFLGDSPSSIILLPGDSVPPPPTLDSLVFQDEGAATRASQALADQVLVDSAQGLFDSMLGLTVGCTGVDAVLCDIVTSYAYQPSVQRCVADRTGTDCLVNRLTGELVLESVFISGVARAAPAVAVRSQSGVLDDPLTSSSGLTSGAPIAARVRTTPSFSCFDPPCFFPATDSTHAVWSRSATQVPAPPAIVLVGLGLLGLAGAGRSRRPTRSGRGHGRAARVAAPPVDVERTGPPVL